MVGKWHVGHSQWKQIPVGKGFESHVGGFMWSLESYTKMMWRDVVTPVNVDWGKYYENGTYQHFAEDRHATVAITDEAVMRMEEHDKQKPLFQDEIIFTYYATLASQGRRLVLLI